MLVKTDLLQLPNMMDQPTIAGLETLLRDDPHHNSDDRQYLDEETADREQEYVDDRQYADEKSTDREQEYEGTVDREQESEEDRVILSSRMSV